MKKFRLISILFLILTILYFSTQVINSNVLPKMSIKSNSFDMQTKNEIVISLISDTEKNVTELIVLHPGKKWKIDRNRFDNCTFIISEIGNINKKQIKYIVTAIEENNKNKLIAINYINDKMNNFLIDEFEGSRIRDIAVKDINNDKIDEIVIGTRGDGNIYIYYYTEQGYRKEEVDSKAYGENSTYIREVEIADADNDGLLEIIATPSFKASSEFYWGKNPGSICLYKKHHDKWEKTVIEQLPEAHFREIAVGDINADGKNEILGSKVGVFSYKQPNNDKIDQIVSKPTLNLYSLAENGISKEVLATLEGALKSRAISIGDIDNDAINEIVSGTRGTEVSGKSSLLLYHYDINKKIYTETIIDETDGEKGFHAVAIGDIDNDGLNEIIASDDSKGEINCYKKTGDKFKKDTILKILAPTFVQSILIGDVDNN